MSLAPGQGQALTQGQVLQHRYRIVAPLGQGGMGAVYRAWHLGLKMPVAIKEMVPQPGLDAAQLDKLRQQFEQEAAVLARLRHPHLVLVTDYFIESGRTYLVMDFVKGESLAARIQRDGPLTEADALRIADHLLDALAYCHSRNVLHRDIKPHNVIVQPDGTAVLVDFGLVKLWDPADPHTKTAIRGSGTPQYAPPEQYGGHDQHTGPQSDLYSLGATLYHALTGVAPPPVTERIMRPQSLRPPTSIRRDMSPRIETAILRALELQPERRFASAEQMAQALNPSPTAAPAIPGASPAHIAPTTQQTMMAQGPHPATLAPTAAKTAWGPAQSRPTSPATGVWSLRNVPTWIWATSVLVVVAVLGIIAIWTSLRVRSQMLSKQPVPTATPDLVELEELADLGTASPMDLVGTGIAQFVDTETPEPTITREPANSNTITRENANRVIEKLRLTDDDYGTVNDVGFSRDGRLVAVSGDSGPWIYEVDSGLLLAFFSSCVDSVWNVRWSPVDDLLAATCADSTVMLYDMKDLSLLGILEGHTDTADDVAWSPDGTRLASCSIDGTVIIWDVVQQRMETRITVSQEWVGALDWAPDGRRIAAGASHEDKLSIISLANENTIIDEPFDGVWAIRWSPDGTRFATSDRLGNVMLWNPDGIWATASFDGEESPLPDIDWSPDGTMLVSVGAGDLQQVRIWDAENGALLATLHNHRNWIWGVDWSPTGDLIASAGRDGAIILWGLPR